MWSKLTSSPTVTLLVFSRTRHFSPVVLTTLSLSLSLSHLLSAYQHVVVTMPIATSPILAPSSSLPPTIPQSILRGSTTKRKHSSTVSSDVDDDYQQRDVVLAAKRRKVAFSSEPTVRILDEHGEKSTTLVREEIRHAIAQHISGNDEAYNEIIQILGTEPHDDDAVSDLLLGKYLRGLISNASILSKSCADLVHAALGMKWLARDEKVVQRYIRFLSHLSIANSGFTSAILKMLVDNFAHRMSCSMVTTYHIWLC